MADTGVPLNLGTGAGGTADTETNASRSNWQMQRVKIVLGTIDADGGDVASGNPMPVSGTFWQATQPVSLASLPSLPSGSNVIGGVKLYDSAGNGLLADSYFGGYYLRVDPSNNGSEGATYNSTNFPQTAVFAGVCASDGNVHSLSVDTTGHILLGAGASVIGAVTQSGGPWSVSWSGQTVGLVAGSAIVGKFGIDQTTPGTTNGVQVNAALPTGANVIGGVTQSGGPWTVSWSGQTVAATQSGTWNIGSITTLPALPTGSNTIGAVGINNKPVGSASIATAQAGAIGTSATSIIAARTGAAGTGRISATLYNYGSVTVYVGPSGVTTSTGIPLLAGASLTIDTTAALYGVVVSGTGTVAALESY